MPRLTLGDISPLRLADFAALATLDDAQRATVLESSSLRHLEPGDLLFKDKPPAGVRVFLVQGELELVEASGARSRLYAGGNQARQALEDCVSSGATARALDEVTLLQVPASAIDDAMNSLDAIAFTIEYTPTQRSKPADAAAAPAPAPATPPPGMQQDWMTTIQQSALLADFSMVDVQRLFMELEHVECAAGEEIVTMGQRGEFFYILTQGKAEVLTDPRGPFAGERFELLPGAHFGEEALIADTPRNATVRMQTAGAVARLDQECFDAIFRKILVQEIERDKAESYLRGARQDYALLDVRMAAEFGAGHHEGARNLPIQMLRKSLATLDRQGTYLVAPEGGRRSELAVFMLRQAGMRAFLVRD